MWYIGLGLEQKYYCATSAILERETWSLTVEAEENVNESSWYETAHYHRHTESWTENNAIEKKEKELLTGAPRDARK